ncbi:MAG: triacylglycerol lipase [Oscillospiraceae bacterium]|nr:triacylglycerol lipase [Oscillospiraceae bacterium]
MLIKRVLHFFLLYALSNLWILLKRLHTSSIWSIGLSILLFAFFLFYNANPRNQRTWATRMEALMGGRELLLNAFLLFFADIILSISLFLFSGTMFHPTDLMINGGICLVLLLILVWNGIIRLIAASKQLSLSARLALFFAWWVPAVNFFLIWHCCHVVHREYLFNMAKKELNESRKENEICKTNYPILLVHGIFWRDWQLFNYWGRIPKELIRNGATIYYGHQQSAAPIKAVAGELKSQILNILGQEKCEKVNIIAHSKGGLDARYMISCLGMEDCVASLTTVCTPHRGSVLLDRILKRLPDSAFHAIAKRYNTIYRKLGDTKPDFYAGIRDLTTKQCAQLNQTAVNKEKVFYQSIASQMSSFFSAGFPLNVGYAILRHAEGKNDGFVSRKSAQWGNYLGCFSTEHRRGISHGDMIDLMRENIRGFDVCECYVNLVKDLKSKGF